tara:strand:- start:545 stop:1405 length:861 start_codon:yes stop_codon:yes gene_type:complete
MKNFIIKQGGGIGDILFSLRIAKLIYKKYKADIIWPIVPSLLWIKDYIKTPYIKWESYADYPWINDVKENQPFKMNEDTVLVPLSEASNSHDGKYTGSPIMEAKYLAFGLTYNNWQDDIIVYRNKEKEDELFYNVLGLKDNDEYTYIHRQYGTPSVNPNLPVGIMKSKFMPDELFANKKIVEGHLIPEFTVFDWLKVIEKAKDIHVVSTCLFYILEAVDKKLPEIKIYNRDDNLNLFQLHFLKNTLRQKWKFIETEYNTTTNPWPNKTFQPSRHGSLYDKNLFSYD